MSINLAIVRDRIRRLRPEFAGIILFWGMLFGYGLVNNLNFSYMGNTSSAMVAYVFQNFAGEIVRFLLLIFACYFVLAQIWLLVIWRCTRVFCKVDSLKKMWRVAFGFLLSALWYMPLFFRDMVMFPQMYISGWHQKGALRAYIMDTVCGYSTPGFWLGIVILMLVALVSADVVLSFRKKKYTGLYFWIAAGIICALGFGLNNREPAVRAQADASRPSILILASDALRPDHLGAYGYERATSPAIDSLAEKGISFTDLKIEVPRTFPSWVSLLTGQYASRQGIRHMFPTSMDLNRTFNAIPFEFNKQGYYTAVCGDYAADVFSRIDLGFQKVDAPFFNADSMLQQAMLDAHSGLMPFVTGKLGLAIFPVLKDSAYFCPPELVTGRIKQRIAEAEDRPFFLVTFFSSTHFPYAPPFPYYSMFSEKDYDGPYRYLKQKIISIGDQTQEKGISDKDIAQVRALYDGGIRAFDDQVGELLHWLEETGRLENTIIVVTADHGENLYEPGMGMGHGEHFRGELATKAPFIVYWPKRFAKQQNINQLVRQVDIAPTLLELSGLDVPETVEGRSMLPLLENPLSNEHRAAFGETGIWFDTATGQDLFFQELRIMYPDITGLSVVDFHFRKQIVLNDTYRDIINVAKHRYVEQDGMRLIYMPMTDAVRYELYDLENDPLCAHNLINERPADAERLKAVLFSWITRDNDVFLENGFALPTTRY